VLKLSVIIPSYNDAEMLSTCLSALASQTVRAWEVVVVDNNSTDNTAEVARSFGARVVFEPLRGIPSATAAGFDAARGDVFGRLDADSVPQPDWCERVIEAFTENPHLAAITGSADFYGGRKLTNWIGRNIYINGYLWSAEWALGHPPIFGSNCALSRSTWERISSQVHRDIRTVHDDLDISIALHPEMEVLVDNDLRVAVSARPFDSARGLGRRLWWAYTTVRVNWREESLIDRRRRHRVGRG